MKKGFNIKVTLLSIMALAFLVLTYTIHWLFIVPVAVIIYINQKEILN